MNTKKKEKTELGEVLRLFVSHFPFTKTDN